MGTLSCSSHKWKVRSSSLTRKTRKTRREASEGKEGEGSRARGSLAAACRPFAPSLALRSSGEHEDCMQVVRRGRSRTFNPISHHMLKLRLADCQAGGSCSQQVQ